MNAKHRAAKQAQSESIVWFSTMFFKHNIEKTVQEAIIYNLKDDVLTVFIPDYRIKGNIYLKSKSTGMFISAPEKQQQQQQQQKNETAVKIVASNFDDKNLRLTLSMENKKSISYRLFDHILVRIEVLEHRAHLPQFVLTLAQLEKVPLSSAFKQQQQQQQIQQQSGKKPQQGESSKSQLNRQYMDAYATRKKQKELKEAAALTEYAEYVQNQNTLYAAIGSIVNNAKPVNLTILSAASNNNEEPVGEIVKQAVNNDSTAIKEQIAAIEKKLQKIEKLKQSQGSGVELNKVQALKLASEDKYSKLLAKLNKKLVQLS